METVINVKDITPKGKNKKLHLVFSGELDETNADDIMGGIMKKLEGKKEVIFDFNGLQYLNSKSIGYIAEMYSEITDANEDNIFKIINTSEGVLDILELVGLTSIMDISGNK